MSMGINLEDFAEKNGDLSIDSLELVKPCSSLSETGTSLKSIHGKEKGSSICMLIMNQLDLVVA